MYDKTFNESDAALYLLLHEALHEINDWCTLDFMKISKFKSQKNITQQILIAISDFFWKIYGISKS